MKRLVSALCVLLVLSTTGQTVDFNLSGVRRVCSGVQFQWSPEGGKIACANNEPNGSCAVVVDTTGTEHYRREFPLFSHTLAWVDDDEVAIMLHSSPRQRTKHVEILSLRLGNQDPDTVLIYDYPHVIYPFHPDYELPFVNYKPMGPYRTFEGTAYYTIQKGHAQEFHLLKSSQNHAEIMASSHILKGGARGTLLVSLDSSDTIPVADTSYSSALLHPNLDLLFSAGYLVNLTDGSTIDLRAFPELSEAPEGMYLGFSWAYFSPTHPELTFGTSYDDGHYEGEYRSYLLDYSTMELVRLDDLNPIAGCGRFQYSPCGRWLAFACADGTYMARIERQ